MPGPACQAPTGPLLWWLDTSMSPTCPMAGYKGACSKTHQQLSQPPCYLSRGRQVPPHEVWVQSWEPQPAQLQCHLPTPPAPTGDPQLPGLRFGEADCWTSSASTCCKNIEPRALPTDLCGTFPPRGRGQEASPWDTCSLRAAVPSALDTDTRVSSTRQRAHVELPSRWAQLSPFTWFGYYSCSLIVEKITLKIKM